MYRKMFNECTLHLGGKIVAFACGNNLFVKPSDAAAKLAPDLPQVRSTLALRITLSRTTCWTTLRKTRSPAGY